MPDEIVIVETSPGVIQVVEQTTDIIQVHNGIAGPPGPVGPPGPPGGEILGVVADIFSQAIPSDVWNITHGLDFQPNITVVDSAGSTVEGHVQYIDPTTIRVTFSAGFSGTAYLS